MALTLFELTVLGFTFGVEWFGFQWGDMNWWFVENGTILHGKTFYIGPVAFSFYTPFARRRK